ncbi:sensor histidine kinase [Anaerocolumna jejuensis]|uniref:sensor histidine kinase n=1 Tax=Anaerocolumna jejuensis TaxID=259063 RepID=UPI003F7C8317
MSKKKKLSSKILGSVTILIIAGIIQLLFESSILNYYHKQTEHLENNIAEAFLTERNTTFDYLNSDLQAMLYDGSEVQRVSDAFSLNTEVAPSVFEQVNSVSTLKDMFRRMSNTYGNELNFFYYDPNSGKIVEYGYNNSKAREKFIADILTDIRGKNLSDSRDRKWYLYEDNYICTVVRGRKGYAGSWMQASAFTEQIMNMAGEGGVQVELYDKKTMTTFVQDRKNDGTFSTYVKKDVEKGANFRELRYADFQVHVQLKDQNITAPLVFQFLFTLFLVLYLLIIVWDILYLKKGILGQAKYFYNNLLQFSNQIRFHEENGIVEFAEAAKVLNQLADEINRLKIDVYEQQLEKKKVELDYAQLQIRPHFYINCLNVIYCMAQTGRMKEIQNIALQVSKYLRYIFKKSIDPVPLKDELDFLENYLKVQESINGSKSRTVIQKEEGLENFSVPPLMIQTFVENSLKYGMDSEKTFSVVIEAVRIKIEETPFVRILVRDSGMGMKEELCRDLNAGIFKTENESYQVGIRNAVARMKMLYGEKASIHFGSSPEGGAEVNMYFPIKEEQDEDSISG